MPEKNLQNLCERLSKESDPHQIGILFEELIAFLAKEQDAIKANLMKHIGDLPY